MLSGAECILTQAQPEGYTNAYNTPGVGGTGQTGDSGTDDSTISLVLGAEDSTGNNFAEERVASTKPTPIPTLGGFALVMLSLLLGVFGLRRKLI